MQQAATTVAGMAATDKTERGRVEAVVETLSALRNRGESLAEVAHDVRNMVTALGLYCDLLEEPGVLADPFHHYSSELRLVAAASRRLVEKLVALDARSALETGIDSIGDTIDRKERLVAKARSEAETGESGGRHWDLMPPEPVDNFAEELLASRNLLAALAGPSIILTIDVLGGACPVRLTAEDLTRILVNLVKNAAEAMPGGGRIEIGLREREADGGDKGRLVLTLDDNGPGIREGLLEKIFESGFTTHAGASDAKTGWPVARRGLGLAISRSIVEKAGGRIAAANRARGGARFEIELPVARRAEDRGAEHGSEIRDREAGVNG